MSGHRYAEEFQIDAVRELTESEHVAAELAARVGAGIHSVWQWVTRYDLPSTSDLQVAEAPT